MIVSDVPFVMDNLNMLFKLNFYDFQTKTIVCILKCSSNEIIKRIKVSDENIFEKMVSFDVIFFFTKLMDIRIDLYSLYYKPSNYGTFTFDEQGLVTPAMYNKMVIAYCQHDAEENYKILPDNNFNKKYLFKYFDTDKFQIIENNSSINTCHGKNNIKSNKFLLFLSVYCKQSNIMHCRVKYKIHL